MTKWGHNDHMELIICKREVFQLGALITELDRVTKKSYCITALFCVMTVGYSFANMRSETKVISYSLWTADSGGISPWFSYEKTMVIFHQWCRGEREVACMDVAQRYTAT